MSKKKPSHAAESSSSKPAEASTAAAASSWGRSTRETVEAIAIAFALAFLFKTFEAEAFVIPTGSMAPTLMGRHKDVVCPQCGYRYSASGSEETDRNGNLRRTPTGAIDEEWQVVRCTCPICRFPMSVDGQDPQAVESGATPSYSGDRIWVSKVPYHFSDPSRWDVVVFRFPQEAETYYIKRLVGLPGETVKIFHGDIYTRKQGDDDYQLARKPPEKIRAMAQVVDDTDYVSPALVEAGWPARWSAPDEADAKGAWKTSADRKSYSIDGSAGGEQWLRYHHLVPPESFWAGLAQGHPSQAQAPRPQLITDFYAFNTRVLRRERAYGMLPSMLGLHWVGDLMLECTLDVRSPRGTADFDLVKGGHHFRAAIDVATGQAELTIDGLSHWRRKAQTSLRGEGQYEVAFANVDRQLVLWIDGKVVSFDGPTSYEGIDNERPVASDADLGDLAPVGVGSRGAALEVSHLRVLRDIYYIADRDADRNGVITDFGSPRSIVPVLRADDLIHFLSTPSEWVTPRGGSVFDQRQDVTFELSPDQFFVLGDNSPASSDARLWGSEHYVDRSLLVGKALLIYWPHPLNLPIPMTNSSLPVIPNIPDMGFIR